MKPPAPTACRWRRRAIALIAAYALALQPLILGLAWAAQAGAMSAGEFVICMSGGTSADGGLPVDHTPPCCLGCAGMACAGHGSVAALPVGIVVVPYRPASQPLPFVAAQTAISRPGLLPYRQRAPPLG